MKAFTAVIAVFFFFRIAPSAGRSFVGRKIEAVVAPPAPAPALPGLETLHVNFEIENYNYYDLTKVTCPQQVKKKQKKSDGMVKKKDSREKVPEKDGQLLNDLDNHFAKALDNVMPTMNDKGDKGQESPLPWMKEGKKKQKKSDGMVSKKDSRKKGGAALLQLELGACQKADHMPNLKETKSKECTTVMDVLRTVIIKTIKNMIQCLYLKSLAGAPGAAPAPAASAGSSSGPIPVASSSFPAAPPGVTGGLVPLPPQPAAGTFLQHHVKQPSAPAPAATAAAGPAAGPVVPDVNIFVTFQPGKEMEGGRTTLVEISFIGDAANGLDDIAMALPHLSEAIDSGLFKKTIKKALRSVTGIKPKMKDVVQSNKVIEHWPIEKCEEHTKAIVGQFALHYTRNQVPMALYNECTNFMTRLSFSHDYVLDPQDTARCKKATAKFESHWNYGENARKEDFEDMCFHACEAKYGRNAPTCNLHGAHGDGLFESQSQHPAVTVPEHHEEENF